MKSGVNNEPSSMIRHFEWMSHVDGKKVKIFRSTISSESEISFWNFNDSVSGDQFISLCNDLITSKTKIVYRITKKQTNKQWRNKSKHWKMLIPKIGKIFSKNILKQKLKFEQLFVDTWTPCLASINKFHIIPFHPPKIFSQENFLFSPFFAIKTAMKDSISGVHNKIVPLIEFNLINFYFLWKYSWKINFRVGPIIDINIKMSKWCFLIKKFFNS